MIGDARIIWNQFATDGVAPTIKVDTDERSPPLFEDVVGKLVWQREIAPSDADIAVVLSVASCSLLIVSDTAVLLRLKAGETQMRVRRFYVDADDSAGAALPAQTLTLSGNTLSVSNVEIYQLQVP